MFGWKSRIISGDREGDEYIHEETNRNPRFEFSRIIDYHRFVRNRLTRKRGKTRIREKITEIVSIVETDRTLIRKRFHDVKDIMLGLDEYEKACETTTTTRSFYLFDFRNVGNLETCASGLVRKWNCNAEFIHISRLFRSKISLEFPSLFRFNSLSFWFLIDLSFNLILFFLENFPSL